MLFFDCGSLCLSLLCFMVVGQNCVTFCELCKTCKTKMESDKTFLNSPSEVLTVDLYSGCEVKGDHPWAYTTYLAVVKLLTVDLYSGCDHCLIVPVHAWAYTTSYVHVL